MNIHVTYLEKDKYFRSYLTPSSSILHHAETLPIHPSTHTLPTPHTYTRRIKIDKMPPNTISTEEQFQFLISCIRHSREGKVSPLSLFSSTTLLPYYPTIPRHKVHSKKRKDLANQTNYRSEQVNFDEVAQECEIVSKGAAYVPYPTSMRDRS